MIPYPLRQLDELCRAHPLQTKVFFVPASAGRVPPGERPGERRTPLDQPALLHLPCTMPGSGSVRAQPTAWERRLGLEGRRWLVESVLEGPEGEGIRPSTRAAGAGLAEALRRTFDELREAGGGPRVRSAGCPRNRPSPGLGGLYAAYCRELLAQDWWDDARILGAAIETLEGGHAHPPAVWMNPRRDRG